MVCDDLSMGWGFELDNYTYPPQFNQVTNMEVTNTRATNANYFKFHRHSVIIFFFKISLSSSRSFRLQLYNAKNIQPKSFPKLTNKSEVLNQTKLEGE